MVVIKCIIWLTCGAGKLMKFEICTALGWNVAKNSIFSVFPISSNKMKHDHVIYFSFLQQKSSHLTEAGALKPLTSVMDMTDSSLKLSNPHHPLSHHHYNLSRTLLLRRSRHHYGHQYSRRNSANHADASTSHGKITPSCDEKLSFKLANHSKSDFGQHTGDLFSLFFCVCFNGFWWKINLGEEK